MSIEEKHKSASLRWSQNEDNQASVVSVQVLDVSLETMLGHQVGHALD
ncbi:MAG: hypothetical protein ACM3TN_02915 [Alphaproteobacteria bacterium]